MINVKKAGFVSYFSILFLTVCLICAGCSGSESDDEAGAVTGELGEAGSSVILPLALGNTWTYTWTTGVADPYTETISVSAIQSISGQDTYKTGTSTLYNFYKNHEYGLYNYGSNMGISASPSLYLKFPCSVGDIWTYDGGTFNVAAVSETVITEAGTFECVLYYYNKVNDDGTLCVHHEYWAPDIGQIVQDIYLNGVLQLSIELKSYSLN